MKRLPSRPKSAEVSSARIGAYVRRRRADNGMTQRELGELAGTGTRLISDLERGKPTVRLDAINAVLAVFGKMIGVIEVPRDAGEEP